MSDSLRVAIAGLGTVGVGTIKLLREAADLHRARCGKHIEIVAVSARDARKDRGIDLAGIRFESDAAALAMADDVDCVVELIGGSEGIAKELVERALLSGKHVVTANKALIAHHGAALAERAEQHHVGLAFEAAVAGGIPIIHAMKHGLAANRVDSVRGILNGTGNYILTTMQSQGRDFADVLQEAQDLGYAEADPSFDVDGFDTAHKLAILSALAFGHRVDADVSCDGIRDITALDMRYAEKWGFVIKLLGVATRDAHGVRQAVYPCMVAEDSPIGRIDGAFNAVEVVGHAVGRTLFEGAGAGAAPTASAVVADILDIARGDVSPAFGVPIAAQNTATLLSMDAMECAHYIRLSVQDTPGVLEEVTGALAAEGVSVERFIQEPHTADSPAQIVLTTYATQESSMQAALTRIAALSSVKEAPMRLRIADAAENL